MSLFKGVSTTNRADKIASFQSTACDFGTPLPIAYGTCKLAPNLINYQDFETVEKRTTTKSGKSKSTQIDYMYYVYVELALCEGPIAGTGKIWVGDTAYGSVATLNAGDNQGAPLSLNLGNNSSPTTYMQTRHPSLAVGYSNMAYLYNRIFLGSNTASMPSYNVEVYGNLRNTGNGVDANPADIIIDLLTRVGLENYVDSVSFENYRKYCREADLLMSTPPNAFSSQTKVQDVIKTILNLTNAYMFWSVDRYKIVPRDDQQRGDWIPNRTICYNLTPDDLVKQSGGACITFSRKDTSEICNRFGVSFINRDNDYEEETVFFENAASITTNGLNAASTIDGKWFYKKSRAIKCAEMQARINNTELIEYTFKLDWAFERLEPGDLVTLTDDSIGLNRQPVMVKSITFDKYGRPTVKAVWREPGNYSAAAYDVHSVDYNYVNLNVEPGDTAAPLFIIPPADLVTTSANGLEIWVALHGQSENWGGCNVYLSDKDGDYSFNGSQPVSSLYGTITTPMNANSTSVTVKFSNPKTVSLLTGSELDANNGNTLIWVNGECMSYTLATLTGTNTYTLTGLIRGQYGTAAAAHSTGDAMAVLDGNIYVVPLTKHYTGRTMYFKFPAFNAFQGRGQAVTEVDYYTCIANTADLPNCTNIQAYNKYRELADDVTRYDIVVDWQPPANFASYQQAQVWYKTSGTQANVIGVVPEGTTGANIGLAGRWNYGGQGYNSVTIPQAVIGDTYRIAVCCQDIYGNVESPDMSPQVSILVALKSEIPNTPGKLGIYLTDTFNIYWDAVRNADIKYYEVRLDDSVGEDSVNLLARTTETEFRTNVVENRTGTIYVFAVSAYSKVSAPAKLTYNFPTPQAPVITCTSKLAGIECIANAIPNNCNGVHWFFDGTDSDNDIVSTGTMYFYNANAGVYEISACYRDYFGDGAKCIAQMVSIAAYIDDSLIKSETITLEKLSADAQKAIEEGGTETVNVAVKGMLGEGSALVLQPSGELALVASNGEVLTGLFANQSGVMRLQGKYIHITGDTVVDGSIITNNMLAGGITADKINVNSLSALCATIGLLRTATSGARMELESNQLRVYDSNGTLRVRLGVW